MNETLIVVVAGMAVAVFGVLTWLVDAGITEEKKRVIRYALYTVCAVIIGSFWLIEDRSEFTHEGWEKAESGPRQRTVREADDEDDQGPASEKRVGSGGTGGAKKVKGSLPLAAKKHKTEKDCDVCPEMIVLPSPAVAAAEAGTTPAQTRSDGPPVPTYGFAIGRFEITVEQYQAFLTETNGKLASRCDRGPHGGVEDGYNFANTGLKQTTLHPATCITGEEAKRYTMWLTEKTGKTYRLPFEDEWDFAARGGARGPFVTGGMITMSQANFASLGVTRDSAPGMVGQHPANEFGLHDPFGNVSEMVANCARNKSSGPDGDCRFRMLKGGSWADGDGALKFGWRGSIPADQGATTVGFRVVRE